MTLVYIGPIFLLDPTPKTKLIHKGIILIKVNVIKLKMVTNK